ncbi:MAG: glycoside hydrolase family 1 protein [Archangium sp.]|nr:glycoside hydrolase family 1 protein [Archangium sp.]MDP3155192.1 glycoside hydrolase family 1 protein [Archangium sp.]MDP3573910.1 glycoside hydrolase family 1 protein [Archangium sp.]
MRPLVLALVLLSCSSPSPKPPFPEKFYFGASTAGFQVDPGCPSGACVDTNSDWYQWVTSGSELQDLKELITFEPLDHAPGFWELYEQDFDRAQKDMGLNSIRLSIEWSRIFPTATDGLEGDALAAVASAENIAAYHAQFAALKARGMTPLVTIHHYTLPLWIHDGVACHKDLSTCTKRGWLDRERIIREIAKYAGFVAKEFGGEVDLWATQNEPFAVVLPGYLLPSKDRVNPPGLSYKFVEAKAVMNAMIEAHARMYDAVKANDLIDADKDGKASLVGLVYPITPTKPKDPENRLDVKAAENIFYLYNTAFLDAVTLGKLDADLNGKPDAPEPVESLAGRMDYLGLNYYTRITVKGTDTASLPLLSSISNFDPFSLELWEDYSKGIYDIQMFVKERYAIPMMITETGTDAASDGTKVESWLVRHLEWTKRAIKDGADVRGFFYWSLTDNYEWNHGMNMKFGLYGVENDAAKTRTARSAVATYANIIKKGDISAELLTKFPPE